MTRNGILVSVTLLFVTSGQLSAKDELAITELYGQAVHSYFNGDYEESHKYLSDAIDLGTDDPRVYYYRGLAKMKLGRQDEASKDFAEGGKLEAAGPAQFYPIGRSLERVQGAERMAIEKVRKQARIAIRLRLKKIEEARIEAFKRNERLRNAGPKMQLGNPTDNSATSEDPFAEGGNVVPANSGQPVTGAKPASGAPATGSTPAKSAPPANSDDPFGTPAKSTPKSDDPFGAPAKSGGKANDDPFAQPSKGSNDDPFGAPKKSGGSNDDPFGGGGAPKTGSEPKSGGSNNADPFADPPKKSDDKKGADDDPFK